MKGRFPGIVSVWIPVRITVIIIVPAFRALILFAIDFYDFHFSSDYPREKSICLRKRKRQLFCFQSIVHKLLVSRTSRIPVKTLGRAQRAEPGLVPYGTKFPFIDLALIVWTLRNIHDKLRRSHPLIVINRKFLPYRSFQELNAQL